MNEIAIKVLFIGKSRTEENYKRFREDRHHSRSDLITYNKRKCG